MSDSNYENRKFISKFRIADHSLEIERGRYKKVPGEQRLCSFYNLNEVDDEVHFFLKCDHNKLFRSNLLYDFNISNVNPYLDSLKTILNPKISGTEDRGLVDLNILSIFSDCNLVVFYFCYMSLINVVLIYMTIKIIIII